MKGNLAWRWLKDIDAEATAHLRRREQHPPTLQDADKCAAPRLFIARVIGVANVVAGYRFQPPTFARLLRRVKTNDFVGAAKFKLALKNSLLP